MLQVEEIIERVKPESNTFKSQPTDNAPKVVDISKPADLKVLKDKPVATVIPKPPEIQVS